MADMKDDFVIDVAKEHKYQNQNDEYYNEFLKWRTDASNPYGYKFVHDTREHAYIDGEGYIDMKPAKAEKKALGKCCGLIGVTMLVMLLVDVLGMFVIQYILGVKTGFNTYYSDYSTAEPFSPPVVYTAMAFRLLKYLIPIAIFGAFTKIPRKVALPSGKLNYRICGCGVIIMLVVMAIGRIADYLFTNMLHTINVDSVYSGYIRTQDNSSLAVYIVAQYLLIPILTEILFRGCFLQFFRQFGDLFAILITSFVNCMCGYDFVQFGYIFCVSLVLGLFTIRTGSLMSAIIMRLAAQFTTFAVNFVILTADYIPGKIVETVACLVIFLCSIFIYIGMTGKGEWNFNIEGDASALSMGEKIKSAMTSTPLTLWAMLAVAVTVLSLRFLS